MKFTLTKPSAQEIRTRKCWLVGHAVIFLLQEVHNYPQCSSSSCKLFVKYVMNINLFYTSLLIDELAIYRKAKVSATISWVNLTDR